MINKLLGIAKKADLWEHWKDMGWIRKEVVQYSIVQSTEQYNGRYHIKVEARSFAKMLSRKF